MKVEVLSSVRAGGQYNFSEGTDEQMQINTRGDLLIAQSLPASAEIVRLGNSYWASTITAAAPVVAIPTTAALIGLWNGEPANGKSYIIDSVFCLTVASTAAQQTSTVLGNVSLQPVLTALANTIAPRCLRANLPYRGQARVAVGITLDASNGVATNWMPIGSNPSQNAGATNNIGSCIDVPVNGLIIIPPGGQLALSAISAAATASSIQIGFRWHEAILPPVV